MNLAKKISQIKHLPLCQVDNDWERTTKHQLLSEIYSQHRLMKAHSLTAEERFRLFSMKITRRLMPSLAKTVAFLLVIFLGSGMTFAAQASVPGEALWPIKRGFEKAELTLAVSSTKEAEVYIKHITKRLQELDKIVASTKSDPDKQIANDKVLKQVISYLGKDTAAVDKTLQIVKEEKEAPLETVLLAQKVKEVANQTKDKVIVLEAQALTNNNPVLEQALAEVKTASADADKTAVKVAVEVHQEVVASAAQNVEKSTNSQADQKQAVADQAEVKAVQTAVAEIIKSEISQLTTDIQDSKKQAEAVNSQVNKDIVQVTPAININGDVISLKEISEKPKAAEGKLGEAKLLLDAGSFKDAADKLLESKVMQENIGSALRTIEKTVKDSVNSTSTIEQVKPISKPTTLNTINTASTTTEINRAMNGLDIQAKPESEFLQ
ncbi:MAG: hypothetical protein UR94_C0001G0033 [Parcubacteria group bacterium GW2011_GWA2_36_10]|nr:MAG: hypothetical protein UR94_C0001G0033 [Parcubacteria group bacterium GW2011_GWA2_36_10]